jgi:Xaa-Pro aminopeptidase
VLTDPASIAWLFNIRGGDVPRTPLALSFASSTHPAGLSSSWMAENFPMRCATRWRISRDVARPGRFSARLRELGQAGRKVLVDRNGSAEAVARAVEEAGGTVVEGSDPVALPKARKNAVELAGARAAHLRDGVAVLRFLRWLEGKRCRDAERNRRGAAARTVPLDTAAESDIPLADLSFETISSTGPNGAINHYRVTEATNRRLENGELYLVDSGAQYRDGTTDITRTLPVGRSDAGPARSLSRPLYPRAEGAHRHRLARFPKGATGAQLDTLAARRSGRRGWTSTTAPATASAPISPCTKGRSASPRPATRRSSRHDPLQRAGLLQPRRFRHPIENLVVVREAEPVPGGDRPMLSFETITLAPIDRRLILTRLMSPAEIAWLDTYHLRVYGALSGWPTLTGNERAWLAAACRRWWAEAEAVLRRP